MLQSGKPISDTSEVPLCIAYSKVASLMERPQIRTMCPERPASQPLLNIRRVLERPRRSAYGSSKDEALAVVCEHAVLRLHVRPAGEVPGRR